MNLAPRRGAAKWSSSRAFAYVDLLKGHFQPCRERDKMIAGFSPRRKVWTNRKATLMQDRWYGDNRDLVKWGTQLELAQKYRVKHILQVLYYRKNDWNRTERRYEE